MEDIDPQTALNQQMMSYYHSPVNQYGPSVIALTNPDNEITKMELTFRGMMMDQNGKLKKVGHPLMNDKGILAITGMTQSLVNQVTIMSYLEDNTVQNIMQFFIYTLVKDLMLNEDRYEMGVVRDEENNVLYHDRAARDKVYQITLEQAYICVLRAHEGGERRFLKGSQHENIIKTEGASGAPKGVGSILSFWKK